MIHADTPAGCLRAAREAIPCTMAYAARAAGLRSRQAWYAREGECTPRVASRLLTALHGEPWVCVEGPGWAVAGPADEVRKALSTEQP